MPPFVLALAMAAASGPQARLAFASETPACSEPRLRDAVATRLGYDPFVAEAALGVAVRISSGAKLEAQVTVSRAGAPAATRTLTGAPDCVALTNSVALALAVAVDPLVLTRPPPEPAPAAEPTPAPVAPPPASRPEPEAPPQPPPAPAEPARPLRFDLPFAAGVELGQQPAATPGFRAGIRVGGETFSALVEAVLTTPSRLRLDLGSIETFFVGGDAGLCAGTRVFSGCALVRAGGLRFQGDGLADVRSGWLGSVSAGARASVEWPADTLLAGQLSAEVRVPITRPRLFVGAERVWEQGWVLGSGAAALVVRLP